MVTASGSWPFVNAFDKHKKSGVTLAELDANKCPVLPNPVATSSEIKWTLFSDANFRTLFKKLGDVIFHAPSPINNGSIIIAAIS